MANPRFPHFAKILRKRDVDPFTTSTDLYKTIYDGKCRSYTTRRSYSMGSGDILTSIRMLSIPMRRDDWVDAPNEGDYVEVAIGSILEYGHVTDKMPGNFGTTIVWKYGRN